MAKLHLDGVELEIPNDVVTVVKSAIDSRDSKIASLENESKKAQNITVNIDGTSYDLPEDEDKMAEDMKKKDEHTDSLIEKLEGEKEALTSQLNQRIDKDDLASAVKARRILETQAEPHLDSSVDLSNLSDRAIKELVITTRIDTLDNKTLAEYKEERIDGMFSVLVAQAPSYTQNSQNKLEHIFPRSDNQTIDRQQRKGKQDKQQLAKYQNAYKRTLGIAQGG